MKQILCCGILAASVVVARVYGQSNVYSLNICGPCFVPVVGSVVYESGWQKGTPPFNFGDTVNSKLGFNGEHVEKHTTLCVGPDQIAVPGRRF